MKAGNRIRVIGGKFQGEAGEVVAVDIVRYIASVKLDGDLPGRIVIVNIENTLVTP